MNQTDLDSLSQEEIRFTLKSIPEDLVEVINPRYSKVWINPNTKIKLMIYTDKANFSEGFEVLVLVNEKWINSFTIWKENSYVLPRRTYDVVRNNIVNILRNRKINILLTNESN